MKERVGIKIYRIPQTTPGTITGGQSSTSFVQGITTNDIFTSPGDKEYILLDHSGDPHSTVEVNRDDDGVAYIIKAGGEKLYIRGASPSFIPRNGREVFEFYVNPQRLTPTYTKLQTEIRTRGGWEIQHWGNALTELRIDGVSGGMYRQNMSDREGNNKADGTVRSITETDAWKKLRRLRTLYDQDHAVRNREQLTLLGIAVYDTFYTGYFTQFVGPEQDAGKPYLFSYNFTMKILSETNTDVLSVK